MSARDDNFLYKTQATTKPNIHFIGLDQLWKVIVQKFGIIYAVIVIVTTFGSDSDSFSELQFSQNVLVV